MHEGCLPDVRRDVRYAPNVQDIENISRIPTSVRGDTRQSDIARMSKMTPNTDRCAGMCMDPALAVKMSRGPGCEMSWM